MLRRRRAKSVATGVAAVACALLAGSRIHADVVTDGSLGAATTLGGPNFSVTASLGRQAGGNLFHSFSRIDVAAGESLTFAGPASVERVLARVTDGRPTSIDGTLRCTIAGADVFLINRAGVAFGPSASLDVDGSVAVTTADVVRLADGGTFSARAGSPVVNELLTSAPPNAFGFLTPGAGGTVAINGSFLLVRPSNSLVIAGGQITAGGGGVAQAPGGKIEVAAVSTGELNVDVANLHTEIRASDDATLGPVGLTFWAADVSGSPAGRVSVLARDLALSGANITADSFGDTAAGTLNVRATNAMSVQSSRISTTAFGGGRGATMSIEAHSVDIAGGSSIFTSTSGLGAGGDVVLRAGTLRLSGDPAAAVTTITADTASAAGAAGGSVIVRAGDVSLIDHVFLSARTFSTGRAGSVDLTSSGTLHINQGAAPVCGLFVEALAGSSGAGGDLRVDAAHVQLDKGSIASSAFGAGPGGSIDLTVGDMQIGGRAELAIVSAQTTTQAPAGATRLHAGALRLGAGGQVGGSTFAAGAGGALEVDAADLSIDGMNTGFFTGLFTQTQAAGDAGLLSVTAQTMRVINGGTVSTITTGVGDAGPVSVAASGAIAIEHGERFQTGIISRTSLTSQPAGRGGDVTVVTPSLRLVNGAITATSDGEGDSGAITVKANDVFMQDVVQGAVTRSQVSTAATGAVVAGASGGAGGDIRIDAAGAITIRDGAYVATESFTTRRSGDIHITAGRLEMSGAGVAEPERLFDIRLRLPDGSEFRLPVANTSEIGTATLLGPAGNITLDVGRLSIESNSYVSASTGGPGKGGDVDIRATDTIRIAAAGSPFLTGVFVASLLPQSGAGGSIRMAARDVQVVEGGIISGETFGTAPGGNVTVAASERVLLSGAGASGPTGISVQTEGEVGGPGGALSVETSGSIVVTERALITASSFGSGAGGAVTLRGRDVTVDRGGFVSSVSRGTGEAGSVSVVADRSVTLRDGGTISTSAEQTSGGNIEIQARERLDLRDSRIAASAGQDGGNLAIDPEFVLLNRSALAANAVNGNGGNMDIAAGTYLQSADSTIDVSSRFGLAGTVSITAPEVDVAAALAALDSSLVGTEARLLELCGRRAGAAAGGGGKGFSSFVVTARGGAPLTSGGFEPSFVIATRAVSREDSLRRK